MNTSEERNTLRAVMSFDGEDMSRDMWIQCTRKDNSTHVKHKTILLGSVTHGFL